MFFLFFIIFFLFLLLDGRPFAGFRILSSFLTNLYEKFM